MSPLQLTFTYNDQRNFVECNPVKEISDDLVYLTKDTSSAFILLELEEREKNADVPAPAEDVPAPAEDVPAPTPTPAPAPAPAPTLETVEE